MVSDVRRLDRAALATNAAPESTTTAPHGTARSAWRTRLRTRLSAGLILVIPIWITAILIRFIFTLTRDASLWLVEGLLLTPWGARLLDAWRVSAEALRASGVDALPPAWRWCLGIVSVLLTLTTIYVLGVVTTHILGRRLVHAAETVVDRVPLVKTVYRASKQVLEAFAGESTQAFQRVALVPFPTDEIRTLGFVTQLMADPVSGEKLCAVFVPTSPNPTTGFVFIVRRDRIVEMDWTVEDAVKAVMSGGVLLPDVAAVASQERPREAASV